MLKRWSGKSSISTLITIELYKKEGSVRKAFAQVRHDAIARTRTAGCGRPEGSIVGLG